MVNGATVRGVYMRGPSRWRNAAKRFMFVDLQRSQATLPKKKERKRFAIKMQKRKKRITKVQYILGHQTSNPTIDARWSRTGPIVYVFYCFAVLWCVSQRNCQKKKRNDMQTNYCAIWIKIDKVVIFDVGIGSAKCLSGKKYICFAQQAAEQAVLLDDKYKFDIQNPKTTAKRKQETRQRNYVCVVCWTKSTKKKQQKL